MNTPPLPEGEPGPALADPHTLLEGYLDYYRHALLRKISQLSETELRIGRLPSGWTPLELVRHLAHVERRWLVWGFLAEKVPDPWGDHDGHNGWHVPEELSGADVIQAFEAQCARSREITAAAELDQRAGVGGGFSTQEETPTLAWILFHLLQEYARHMGHLDVAVELAGGAVGE
ncbi:DinB family protein [Streptomyces axinellae]|jgi:uncharacterized damage-inducible protein DinB|uniref:DinB family protein n=1 Tax=Streptomyces axinellae TaxID=552788 RepID=UPI0031DE0E11